MCQITPHNHDNLDIESVANYWLQGGGDASELVNAVAVAFAESNFNRFAVSSACAVGLWQILESAAAQYGNEPEALYDPAYNAWQAITLLQGPLHWGYWDVCYAEGEALTARRYIASPEPGSAAYNVISSVAGTLGIGNGIGGLPEPGGYTQNPLSALPPLPTAQGSVTAAGIYLPDAGDVTGPQQFIGWPDEGVLNYGNSGWNNIAQLLGIDQGELVSRDERYRQQVIAAASGQLWNG